MGVIDIIDGSSAFLTLLGNFVFGMVTYGILYVLTGVIIVLLPRKKF